MSSRTTRSSARLAAQSAAAAAGPGPPEPSEQIPRPNPRKRKASNLRQPNPDTEETPSKATPPHRIKRPRRSVGVKEEPASPRLQPGGMAKPG